MIVKSSVPQPPPPYPHTISREFRIDKIENEILMAKWNHNWT